MINKSFQYLILSIITFIAGYVFLKTAYEKSQNYPFSNEIVLIILGTIVTMAITSALLSKQSEVELEKEQRVKLFDIKSTLYFELIDFIENILLTSDIQEKDIINLEFLSHKLSVLANQEVLKEYDNFVKKFKKI